MTATNRREHQELLASVEDDLRHASLCACLNEQVRPAELAYIVCDPTSHIGLVAELDFASRHRSPRRGLRGRTAVFCRLPRSVAESVASLCAALPSGTSQGPLLVIIDRHNQAVALLWSPVSSSWTS
jgi:hypothetical protein